MIGSERLAVHDAAKDGELLELLFFGRFDDLFCERDNVRGAPAERRRASQTVERGLEHGAGDGASGQTVLDDHDADVFLSENGTKLIAVVNLHTDNVDEKCVIDAVEALLQVFGNNILYKLTHGNSFRLKGGCCWIRPSTGITARERGRQDSSSRKSRST